MGCGVVGTGTGGLTLDAMVEELEAVKEAVVVVEGNAGSFSNISGLGGVN